MPILTDGEGTAIRISGNNIYLDVDAVNAAMIDSEAATASQILVADGSGGASWQENPGGDSPTVAVSSNRTLTNADHNAILVCTGSFTITLPTGLQDDFLCMILNVGSGTVSVEAGASATLDDGNFTLDSSDGTLTSATVLHDTGGQWYALWSAPAAPKPTVVSSGASLTLDETHDGAIIEVADSGTVTTGGSLPAGWSCTLVRVGATAATIARGTGHTLNGPGGDAASFTIDNQWEAAALYSRGSDQFVLVGPVT